MYVFLHLMYLQKYFIFFLYDLHIVVDNNYSMHLKRCIVHFVIAQVSTDHVYEHAEGGRSRVTKKDACTN